MPAAVPGRTAPAMTATRIGADGVGVVVAVPVACGVAVIVGVSVMVPLAVAVAVEAGVAVLLGVGVGLTGKRTGRCASRSPPMPINCAVTVTVWPA